MENKEWLTTKEACQYTNRSIETIRRWMTQQPKIRKEWGVRERHWFLKKEDLDTKMKSFKRDGK
mgnify:CR=1 FL=1